MTTQPVPAEREYVLGANDVELGRLGLQHRLWSRYALDLWERAGIGVGHRVLDVGCGPGYATIDLATLIGARGSVLAVDESSKFLDHLRGEIERRQIPNIRTQQSDVTRLDLEPDSFDAAYARWVLCFVNDVDAVVASVARALRPGGVFCVQDYFNYRAVTLAPHSDAFTRIVQATDRSWRQRGGDPDVAGRLPAIMQRHGLEVREIRPILRVARPGSLLWQWPETFFINNYLIRLREMEMITEDEKVAAENDWAARSADPASYLTTPPVMDIIAVKRG
ncbi:MAG: class I SAM-dependent methyltransferase [Planctomycetota bacterium]|nr:class I SAM-dependent methyltransferase [Planctomycetota bacterium]